VHSLHLQYEPRSPTIAGMLSSQKKNSNVVLGRSKPLQLAQIWHQLQHLLLYQAEEKKEKLNRWKGLAVNSPEVIAAELPEEIVALVGVL